MKIQELTIKELKEELTSLELEAISAELLLELAADSRKGVQQLAARLRRQKKRLAADKERLKRMQRYEKELRKQGYSLIGGIDEAGRGPLAGPVVAAVVILPPEIYIQGLNDSKQLSEAKREKLFAVIQKQAIDLGVGIVEAGEIDKINIRQANYRAMRQAIDSLTESPDYLLVDGEEIPGIEIEQQKVVDGDQLSISIAAASIIAKVTRDRILVEYDQQYPEYGFKKHKGYGTEEHVAALEEVGPCAIHRYSFSKVKEAALSEDYRLFAQGLKEAQSIAELEAVAQTIQDCGELLSELELAELRQLFKKEKQSLE
ncbi:ribonuclease HII [Fuchsiella alkaliacetigena]|uniref:ribonuclease HII n=1 Tax=Fuchsiella alkaliacetigena TaxID=957042 RepID=UPI00200A9CDA|nr:ribonuclease HII [Fuchsiella alkaliacetigena]MCK8825643.1 ribonuclease HII [Fuchsiella alkaliacetigena]